MKNNYSRLKWVALIILGGILLFLAKSATAANLSSPLLLQQEVSGKVIDQNGIPIPGVTVSLKGTSRGTLTSLDGEYSITTSENAILVFSFIGYKTHEEQINNYAVINVQLKEDIASLGEVQINAGYYNTTRRESTGNISRVTAEEIELQPVVNPIQALVGRMAGVEITQRSGISGSAPNIRIRGQNSLRTGIENNGNLPLYIIDGLPINSSQIQSIGSLVSLTGTDPLSTINLSNIKSIEVLKDADATAIYGSRGANGVILITTKKGESSLNGLQVDGQIYTGSASVANFMNLMDTQEYLNMRNEAFENDGATPTNKNAYDLLLWDQNRYTDWQKKLFGGNSSLTDVNLSLSGGNSLTSFRLGGAYHQEGTVFPGDFGYNKTTVNLAITHNSKDNKLQLQLTTNYGNEERNLFDHSFVPQGLTLPPNAPSIYNEDGSLNWENSTWNNPFAVLLRSNDANTNSLFSNLSISYNLFKVFTLKANLGYSNINNEETIKIPVRAYDPEIQYRLSHRSSHYLTDRQSWITEPQLIYDKSFGNHNLNIITGLTFQQSKDHVLSIGGIGYSDESLIGNLAAAEQVNVNTDSDITYRYAAIFGRLGYNWNKKYFLNLTGRRDGSSRFGSDKRFANFGAVGAAWIFSEDKAVTNSLNWLSFGKIRGSYGITGSDQIPDYGYLDTFEPTPGPDGLYPTQLTNPDYSWEINKKLELGTEVNFFKDRINLGISWYRNKSSNQLVGYPLPAITGFTSVQANLPATVQNTGWELEFNSYNIQGKDITWQTSFNLTIPDNKLISFYGIEQTSYNNTYKVGYPLNIKMLYKYTGIDPETGLYSFEDFNKDGKYGQDDRTVIKDIGRSYYGGLQNTLNYRNFSLQFLWEFVKQQGPGYLSLVGTQPGEVGNKPIAFLNSWEQSSDQTDIQRNFQSINALLSYYRGLGSDLAIEDNSFARLKNLSFSYQLPTSLLKSLYFEKVNIFLHGQNLLTITDYKGLDPQTGNRLPALRTFTGGIQFNF